MFDGIIGNQRVKEQLVKSLRDESFHHAYLFYGPKGTQKTEAAMLFVQGIFCTGKIKPCGICPSCIKISKGNHPDLHIIEPAEDKESISIDQIRWMQRSIAAKPYEGDRKVYLLRRGETMKDPAQNAMLKVLEEPEKGTVILIISSSKSSLLPTLLSRCQLCSFSPLTYREFEKEWMRRKPEDIKDLEILYNLTQGRLGEALHISQNPKELQDSIKIFSWLDQVLRGDRDGVFRITAYGEQQGINARGLTDLLLIYFRGKMLEIPEGTSDETEGLTIFQIHDIIEDILEFQNNLHINLNTSLQVENLLLKIQEDRYD